MAKHKILTTLPSLFFQTILLLLAFVWVMISGLFTNHKEKVTFRDMISDVPKAEADLTSTSSFGSGSFSGGTFAGSGASGGGTAGSCASLSGSGGGGCGGCCGGCGGSGGSGGCGSSG